MTYRELFYTVTRLIEHHQITLGEYEEMTKPLDREVEQEPQKGHWIDDVFGSKCSCCGIHTHLDKFDRTMKFKYCSMCGAKMVDPQESEDKENE